ncbi:helix-turn-helix domain-containing protein [Anoxybacillus flavithermus]
MDMTLTAKIKIYPTAEQAEVLKATLSAYRQAKGLSSCFQLMLFRFEFNMFRLTLFNLSESIQ